jgi:hypothetical protein
MPSSTSLRELTLESSLSCSTTLELRLLRYADLPHCSDKKLIIEQLDKAFQYSQLLKLRSDQPFTLMGMVSNPRDCHWVNAN